MCKAACEAPLHVYVLDSEVGEKHIYGENIHFIANDWHAGLVPVYIRDIYQPAGVFKSARCTLAIHNLAHQGIETPSRFKDIGLPDASFGTLEWIAEDGHRSINIMKVDSALDQL